MNKKIINKEFSIKIILPAVLVFSLFIVLIFSVIIPSVKNYMLDGKREMIRELTNSVWSVLQEYDNEISDSTFTKKDAQNLALKRIENIRYGHENKDYFWITNMQPQMVMHPYRTELNNTSLTNYKDPTGKKLFVEATKIIELSGEGYIDYMWQWKDDSTKIVPKLSFVKGYKPWGWIVGTGIYIEDVNEEISSLTNHLVNISIGILFILGVILYFLSRQSLLIENKRREAEIELQESEGKYRSLVEASNDGLVMMLDGAYVYNNIALLNMLGYETADSSQIDLYNLLCTSKTKETSGTVYFKNILKKEIPTSQFSAQLEKADGSIIDVILYSSKIILGDKEGYSIIIKDISTNRKIEEELDLNKEKYLTLANSIKVGVFRADWGQSVKIIEANNSIIKILGYSKKEEVVSFNLLEIFYDFDDKELFISKIKSDGFIKNWNTKLRTKEGSVAIVSISAVLVKDSQDVIQYLDGTIEDITEKFKLDEERENLIVELQTSLRFLNQPIEHFLKHFISCEMNTSIAEVAKTMTREKYSASLVKTEMNKVIGIITDHDLRGRVIAEKYDMDKPIYEVMSSPLITISSSSFVFDAFIKMNENSTRHLAVKNSNNEIIGIISSEELVAVQRNSTTYLLSEIERAETVEELASIRNKLPRLVGLLIESGARSKIISHIITSIFDAIAKKLISIAISQLGVPPVKFTFITLGSIGREEQTLTSDQDNAIIYEDAKEEAIDEVHKYFHNLGVKVCDWLNMCGYEFCPGEAMANNPKWCQPISKWKKYFHTWITNSDQQDLIDLSIFFDFRSVYGEVDLSNELRKHLFEICDGQAGFFQHLAKNSLLHKPPMGIFGKIVVESKGEHQEKFDIKSAIMPISDFSRIYSLKNGVSETNTIERLDALLRNEVINKTTYEELKQAYNYLMQLRFRHQAKQISQNEFVDNHINPSKLTQIEQNGLKNIFAQILSIQKKLSYDFTGEAL